MLILTVYFFHRWHPLLINMASRYSFCSPNASVDSRFWFYVVLFILWLDWAFIQSSCLEGLRQVLASESINKVNRSLAHLHHSPPQAVSAAHLIQLTWEFVFFFKTTHFHFSIHLQTSPQPLPSPWFGLQPDNSRDPLSFLCCRFKIGKMHPK